jgi:hypothetical protein
MQLVRCLESLPIYQGLPTVPAVADFVKVLPIFGLKQEVKADRVPRSLCHAITNLSRVKRRSGKAITYTACWQ